MDQSLYQNYVKILNNELVPALGCTEPIAIAYAAAKARATLGTFPERVEMRCSGNIIKNVMGVTVPNSGGLRGIDVAATLGIVGGDADRELEVLEEITQEDIDKTKQLVEEGFCQCKLQEGVENLYIVAKVIKGEHFAEVTIINRHTLITKIVKDGEILFEHKVSEESPEYVDKSLLNVKDILIFADEVKIDDIREAIGNQIALNSAISDEGMKNHYGAEVGRTLLDVYGDDVRVRARARAAAGSDARMGGCSLPVVINSGSGNQGMTVSLPVIEFAKEVNASEEKLYRALVVSNLIAIHQKKYIGSLSAYCGAVSAACGAGAAITYLYGGSEEEVGLTITNTIGNVGGIVCDGAKSSCAAKIASAVEAAILAHYMASKHHCFQPGEGIVQDDVEGTIKSMGYIGRVGMKITDTEILNIMIDRVNVDEA
ncbi:serine dehydratase subunit alpha family protein [Clostridium sp. MCC353]|uniref:L-cysteine desulfidase family protein n=1 Tax=Clostridium sp. MCC353 TaxID=2592646 RepID=UPI001C01DDB8|nr:L-serine ammonia-lyase, iron-sulfur-dependent, subunit alpha [Clostridium sp. MCC353]MBT9777858.1 serine dehydratase subunit alpha family protein [Clostridium sp. MCC353]